MRSPAGHAVVDLAQRPLANPASSLARSVGPAGHVTAVDQSSELLENRYPARATQEAWQL